MHMYMTEMIKINLIFCASLHGRIFMVKFLKYKQRSNGDICEKW